MKLRVGSPYVTVRDHKDYHVTQTVEDDGDSPHWCKVFDCIGSLANMDHIKTNTAD